MVYISLLKNYESVGMIPLPTESNNLNMFKKPTNQWCEDPRVIGKKGFTPFTYNKLQLKKHSLKTSLKDPLRLNKVLVYVLAQGGAGKKRGFSMFQYAPTAKFPSNDACFIS